MPLPPSTSGSHPTPGSCFAGWLRSAPTIVAESLAPVEDPLPTALRPGPWSSPERVARAIAGALGFDAAPDRPPAWLRPEQAPSFGRVLAALRRHGGALLADPVGSGKTFVALAAAVALEPRRPISCLVPATLVEQWRATAERLGIAVCVASHEAASRGRLIPGARGPVLIDEAHRFRHPHTRRYRHVAPWLVGRPVLLITATPVVNRLDDLLHLLLLAVRDDVLRADGVPSLRGSLGRGAGCGTPLGRVIVEARCVADRPARVGMASVPTERESVTAADGLDLLAGLRLSRHPPTAALVRSVLYRAAASSPAALDGALRRYRGLLLHARDARAAGHPLSRRELRRFTGKLEDQLVWWELLPGGDTGLELDPDDLPALDAALAAGGSAAATQDDKVERLRALLADGTPSLVFTASRDTVRYLRDRLGDLPLAWCTGVRAGLGHAVLPRRVVLGWFREGPGPSLPRPARARHLVVTDVAAEGLDLQRAARVVHYDLPWTPMRLDQREGRAIRLGSSHAAVSVVRFTPPAPLDRVLRLERTLARKAALPSTAGLGPAGRSLWRWRAELAEMLQGRESIQGTAVVPEGPPGLLGAFCLYGRGAGGETRLASAVVWVAPDGAWTEDEATIAARLGQALACRAPGRPSGDRLRQALGLLAAPIRSRLLASRGSRWLAPRLAPPARAAVLRVQHEVRTAARRRDAAGLEELERALAFLGGGHTAGEAMLIERLAELGEAELRRALRRLPGPSPQWPIVEARLGGLLLFGEEAEAGTAHRE
jgi:superfamily II DNA or RNA helicase